MSTEPSRYDEERLAALLRELAEPPRAWIEAAVLLPEARTMLDEIVARARSRCRFPGQDPGRAGAGATRRGPREPEPRLVAALRARLQPIEPAPGETFEADTKDVAASASSWVLWARPIRACARSNRSSLVVVVRLISTRCVPIRTPDSAKAGSHGVAAHRRVASLDDLGRELADVCRYLGEGKRYFCRPPEHHS